MQAVKGVLRFVANSLLFTAGYDVCQQCKSVITDEGCAWGLCFRCCVIRFLGVPSEWSKVSHKAFPKAHQAAVRTLVLIFNRSYPALKPVLVGTILPYLGWKWRRCAAHDQCCHFVTRGRCAERPPKWCLTKGLSGNCIDLRCSEHCHTRWCPEHGDASMCHLCGQQQLTSPCHYCAQCCWQTSCGVHDTKNRLEAFAVFGQ
jgi:hypothetical protein